MIQKKLTSYPFYTKLAFLLIIFIALGYIVILAKEILSPLLFSFLFSILLLPMADFFEKKGHFPRGVASLSAVIILVIGISLIFYLVGTQISNLASDWPQFKEQLFVSLDKLQNWISSTFKIAEDKQLKYVNTATSGILSSGTVFFGATVLSLSSILLFLVFIFIYTFFFLMYRSHLLKFLIAVFKNENAMIVRDIVAQIQYIIRKYVIGLFTEMAIVSSVCCIAFMSLGIKYGLLLGLITGLFNIVPYVGIFTALLISLLITFATAGVLSKIVLVLIVIVSMHLIDSNVLLPLIVGSKVRINAFITVLGVVAGEMTWGIPGMFLSIPVIAVSKIIFDRIDSLRPWGMLLGEPEKINRDFLNKVKNEMEEIN